MTLLDAIIQFFGIIRPMKDIKPKKSPKHTAKFQVAISLDKEVVELARKILGQDEGTRSQPYDDATGLRIKGAGAITIGIGRNLDGFPLTEDEVEMIFYLSLNNAVEKALTKFPDLHSYGPSRQVGLISLAYQLAGFSTWTKTPDMVNGGEWEQLRSYFRTWKWYKQTPKRAERVIELICDDRVPRAYGI